MEGLLLGLASGTVCMAYCAPVLVPFFLGTDWKIRRSYLGLASFLLGRGMGYLAFAVLAWLFHELILNKTNLRQIFIGVSFMFLSALLLLFGLGVSFRQFSGQFVRPLSGLLPASQSWTFPILLGLLTGLNICPPFLLAFTASAQTSSLSGSLWFFLTFYLGTSLFLLPFPLIGFLSRHEVLKLVGKLAAVVIAVYYFYSGIILLGGGLITL